MRMQGSGEVKIGGGSSGSEKRVRTGVDECARRARFEV